MGDWVAGATDMMFSPLQIGMCERGWISDLTVEWTGSLGLTSVTSCFLIFYVKNRPRNSIIAHFDRKSNSFLVGGVLRND